MTHGDDLLRSMVVTDIWWPDSPMTGFVFADFGGVHAFKSIAQAKKQYGHYHYLGGKVVLGSVALWGDVIEHQGGWRGESAAVNSLDEVIFRGKKKRWQFWRREDDTLDQLRKKYLSAPEYKIDDAT